MTGIFKNRFAQGIFAAAVVAVAFFAYQHQNSSESADVASNETVEQTTEAAEASASNSTTESATINENQVENAVNNTTESDNITNGEETTTEE